MNVIYVAIFAILLGSCDRNQGDLRGVDPVEPSRPVAETEPEPAASKELPPAIPEKLEQKDEGVFSEYDKKLKLRFPGWLEGHHKVVLRNKSDTPFAYVDGAVAGPAHDQMGPEIEVIEWAVADLDGDGIPSGYDILLGAKKAVINAAPYKGGYQKLEYPGGDVPRTEGVCTDLLVRAVRNAGIDLQQALHEDINARPRAFPMVDDPDTNIDHRRVKTLLPYFVEHWENLPEDIDDQTRPWLPGDIVFMNTMRDERPDHVGVVSDRLGESGYPLIINNWTDGYETSEMDLLGFVPVTHRFRVRGNPRLPREHMGLDGLLKRSGLEVSDEHRQVVMVTGSHGYHATLRRFVTGGDNVHLRFSEVGSPIAAMVGARGLGKEREGDKKAPTGVFELGTAFGPDAHGPGTWPWRQVTAKSRWVDDPDSPLYNTWVEGDGDFASAEMLSMYELGLVVEYNTDAVVPGRGSAIFLHTHGGAPTPTLGCTAVEKSDLVRIIEWLEHAANPVLVQTPGHIF